jgi:lipopolysaccharide exporter
MSTLAHQTARGAALMIVASLAGRAMGVAGTLIMTYFFVPAVVGEVAVAVVIAMTANWLTVWGFGQYVIVKGQGDDVKEVNWHGTVATVVMGVIGLGGVALFGGHIARWVGAPDAAQFVPGMALAIAIRRVGSIPEKLLVRRMRFRPIAMTLAFGELVYAATSVYLAATGWGGEAVVMGNIVQSSVITLILISAAGVREWTTPTPLSLDRLKDMVRFGLPLCGESLAHNASRYWDKLVITHYFGPSGTGVYNLAYNLADIPAIYVGEQIAHVLLPSMARLPSERRPAALERATALLSLIIFPLAIGLGLVADPLIRTALDPAWWGVAPLLMILAALSVFRPVTWVLSTYLEAEAKTSRLFFLEVSKGALLLGGIAALAPYGIEASGVARRPIAVAHAVRLPAAAAGVRGHGRGGRGQLLAARPGRRPPRGGAPGGRHRDRRGRVRRRGAGAVPGAVARSDQARTRSDPPARVTPELAPGSARSGARRYLTYG